MKILSAAQTRILDEFTITHEPVSSINLMERAAQRFVEALLKDVNPKYEINIFCGCGNNGGDGFAIGRILKHLGCSVRIFHVQHSAKLSEDCATNKNRLHEVGLIACEINSIEDVNSININGIIIDALLGSGLNKPLKGLLNDLVNVLNQSNSQIFSVDIPTGLFADASTLSQVIHAHKVITFQLPKLSFLFPEHEPFIGEWQTVNIGLLDTGIEATNTTNFYIDKQEIKSLYQTRSAFGHKGIFGHALVVAGSQGKAGAAVLSAKAALKSGLGLLTCYIPKSIQNIVQIGIPEAMTIPTQENIDCAIYSTIGIGPGLGTNSEALQVFKSILEQATQPLVVDADAINLLSMHPELLNLIPKHSILTPHIGEFRRLVGKSATTSERLEKLRSFTKQHQLIVILKGRNTCVADTNGQLYFNSTGNNGMATAGSGDVLTGILTGLLSQNYNSKDAAIIGVYLHGLAGDLALQNESYESLNASDIIAHLGRAFKQIKS